MARCFYRIVPRAAKVGPSGMRCPGRLFSAAGEIDELRPARPAARRNRPPHASNFIGSLLAGCGCAPAGAGRHYRRAVCHRRKDCWASTPAVPSRASATRRSSTCRSSARPTSTFPSVRSFPMRPLSAARRTRGRPGRDRLRPRPTVGTFPDQEVSRGHYRAAARRRRRQAHGVRLPGRRRGRRRRSTPRWW